MPKSKPKRKAVSKAMGRARKTKGPRPWSQKRFGKFIDQREMRQAYCKYQHLGCSSKPGGPCSDEVLKQNPQLVEGGA